LRAKLGVFAKYIRVASLHFTSPVGGKSDGMTYASHLAQPSTQPALSLMT
jgi:hypothetical protein